MIIVQSQKLDKLKSIQYRLNNIRNQFVSTGNVVMIVMTDIYLLIIDDLITCEIEFIKSIVSEL